jgi:hypothetical protein
VTWQFTGIDTYNGFVLDTAPNFTFQIANDPAGII